MPINEDCERCREFDVSDSEHSLCSFGCSYYLKTTLPESADNTEFQQLAQRLLPILRLMRQFHSSLVDDGDDTTVEIEQHDDDGPFSGVQLNHETMEFEPLNPTEDYHTNEPVFTAQIELVDYPTLPEIMSQKPTTSHVSVSTSVMPDSTEELDQDFLRLLELDPAEEMLHFEDIDDQVEDVVSKVGGESLPTSSIVFEMTDEDRSRINKEDDDEDLEELSEILGLSLDPKVPSSSASPPTTTVATPELVSPKTETTTSTTTEQVKPTEAMSNMNDSEESDDFNEIPDEVFHPEDKKRVVTSNDVRDYFDSLDANRVVKRYKKSQ